MLSFKPAQLQQCRHEEFLLWGSYDVLHDFPEVILLVEQFDILGWWCLVVFDGLAALLEFSED